MNYEQKYKEAVKKVKNTILSDLTRDSWVRAKIYEIFPELKESEDERIKNEIIAFVEQSIHRGGGIPIPREQENKWLAWLEKQSEVAKTSGKELEPKFHPGDWVALGYNILKIKCVGNTHYCFETVSGYVDDMLVSEIDSQFHLWTIQDAKDGDVLAYATDEGDSWIMIYRSLYEPYEVHVHYHALLVNDNFSDKGTCCICIDNLKPATKEQRDLLFQKMKEAGYEWDTEKKEVKKIEPKTLNADEVIEWLDKNADLFDAKWCYTKNIIEQLKQDFKL